MVHESDFLPGCFPPSRFVPLVIFTVKLIFTIELLLEVRRGKYLSSIIALSCQPKDNLKVATRGDVTRTCYTKIIEAVFFKNLL